MRALVLSFASSLAITSAHAGEMAKEGNDSSTIYYVTIAPNEYAGIKRTDSGDEMFDRMSVRSTDHGGHHPVRASGPAVSSGLPMGRGCPSVRTR
jgi:hypothetical protein